jgi:betaine-aldehyde dehydrogenase
VRAVLTHEQLHVVNPATEELLLSFTATSEPEVESAVASARRAFDGGDWPRASLEERIDVLLRARHAFAARAEEFARVSTAQMGAPITGSRSQVSGALRLFDLYLNVAPKISYEFVRRDAVGQALVRREPVGVVAAIGAWNGPVAAAVTKLVPPLLVGCTVVAKPAPQAPTPMDIFAELCADAGVPDGVLSVIHGAAETGKSLVSHPQIDAITFTGSTAAGRWIGAVAGERFARVSLELGGKSAAIVLDDADIDEAVPKIAAGNFWNAGQACIAPTRVLVPRSRHDEIVDALCAEAAAIAVGDPLDERTTMGPLASDRQRERVESYIASGLEQRASIAFGGGRPAGLERGWFVEPTVFVSVDNSMRIAREEIFGPVVSVIPFDDDEDAVRIANDSEYGLHGCVFTSEPEHGLEVARRVRCGTITINGYGLIPSVPFGGVKASGIGREKGCVEGIEGFLEYKAYIAPAELVDRVEADGISDK